MRDIEQLAAYVKQPLSSTVLVIDYKYKTLDRRKSLASLVEKKGVIFESKKIPDYKMPAFITSVLQQRSLTIDPKAAQMLSDFLGNDLNRLARELDKLAIIMAQTGLKRVTPELVEKIEVFNAEKIDGVWEQRLRIHYNCVGTIEIPTVLPLPIPEVSVNTRKGVVVNYAPCELAV